MYVLQRSLRRADALAATAHSRHGLSQHRRKNINKKSPLNRGKAPVHATRPGMLRGRDLAVTLVSCAAPFARAPPPNARRSRPEMGARRTRSGDAQPRSARARNRGRKRKRKKTPTFIGPEIRPGFPPIFPPLFSHFFRRCFGRCLFWLRCAWCSCPPLLRPVAALGISRRGLRGRFKSMSFERSAGCAGDASR